MKRSYLILIVLLVVTTFGWAAQTLSGAAGPGATSDAFRPKSFSVEVTGHGRPMILIPGLTCGGDVWKTTVEHFKGRYECHVLTLAGFAGEPAIAARPMIETVRKDIAAYIRQKKLPQPVIVGHSLGGFLAFWIAASEPDLVGPVISVDGGTYLSVLLDPKATPETAKAQAQMMRTMMDAQTHEQFAANNKMFMSYMITDPKNLDLILPTCSKSDQKAVALAMYEMMTTDLRDEVAKIKTPALLIGAGASGQDSSIDVQKVYEAQIAKIPNHKVVIAEKSRHFIMFDNPVFLFSTMDAFLEKPAMK